MYVYFPKDEFHVSIGETNHASLALLTPYRLPRLNITSLSFGVGRCTLPQTYIEMYMFL